ncbi:MAG: EAL domain-containing protein [Pseudomonadota bacterium]
MSTVEFRRAFPAGAVICEEGAPGDCAYIIEKGAIEIVIHRDGQDIVLARRGVGAVLGEMALLDAGPRSATMRAVDDCVMLVLTNAQLQTRLQELDPVLRMVLSVVLKRFRDSMQEISAATSMPDAGMTAPVEADDGGGEVLRSAIARIEVEQELRQAIAQGDIEFHHQPLMAWSTEPDADAARGAYRVAGYEALARWRRPDGSLMPPGDFITIAEESGLIAEIGKAAVSAACDTLKRLEAEHGGERFVAINVTAADICDPAFFEHVKFQLDAADLPPRALALEITETTLMANAEHAVEMLERYKAFGIRVKIDDFGAGYSNFGYLARYPVHSLKIDKSVVDQMTDAPDCKGATLIRMIASMAKVLGLHTVAEGVETAEQAKRLTALGCDLLQGYHFGRPAPLFEDARPAAGAHSA